MTGNNGAYHPTKTDRVNIVASQTGVIRLNVTADVQGYLAGTFPHQGWMFRKTNEAEGGEALVLSRESGSQPRLLLHVSVPSVPAIAPDTIPTWVYADSNVAAQGSVNIGGPFVKRIVVVMFHPNATQQQKQTAIDSIHGVVVGGRSAGVTNGFYLVRVNDPGDGSILLAAAATLRALPFVLGAGIETFVRPNYLRPSDGPGWTSWETRPALANGDNWALEWVSAPYAWGCSIGDPTTPIAVVDAHFQNIPEYTRNASLRFGNFDSPTPTPLGSHGTLVTSLLAARGDNDSLMAGMRWKSDIRLYAVGSPGYPLGNPLTELALLTKRAAEEGARIINLSLGLDTWDHVPTMSNPADVNLVVNGAEPLAAAIRSLEIQGFRPLLVMAAGNRPWDAYWNVLPAVKGPEFGGRILVVAGAKRSASSIALWDSSSIGPLLDVIAPAANVYSMNGVGSIVSASGTSFAAPIVTGIAGLALSIDASLPAESLKALIVNGALATGVSAGGVPAVNAYETLKLAARRRGAALCGSETWVADGFLKVRRSATDAPAVFDTIADLNDIAGLVNTRHGGRRVDVVADAAPFGLRSFEYRPTQRDWIEITDPFAVPDSYPGGTFAGSLWTSHDLDSSVSLAARGTGGFDVILQVASIPQTMATIPGPASSTGGTVCWRQENFDTMPPVCKDSIVVSTSTEWARPAFSPRGDRILVAVNVVTQTISVDANWQACPGTDSISGVPRLECKGYNFNSSDTGHDLWEVPFPSPGQVGAPNRLSHGSGGPAVWWLGVSEDGERIVVGEGKQITSARFDPSNGWVPTQQSNSYPGCRVRYQDAQLVFAPRTDASPEACYPYESAGTIAPIRRPVSSRRSMPTVPPSSIGNRSRVRN